MNVEASYFWRDYFKKLEFKHPSTNVVARRCSQSNFPYTANLTLEEIACLRDTYAGPRRKLPSINPDRQYDRIFHLEQDWDQRTHRDDAQFLPDCQRTYKDEDFIRAVPLCANSIYGHRHYTHVDYLTNHRPKVFSLRKVMYTTNRVKTMHPFEEAKVF